MIQMIQIVLYSPVQKRCSAIREIVADISAGKYMPDCNLKVYGNRKDWADGMQAKGSVDILFCDVTDRNAVELLPEIHKNRPGTRIVPIADGSVHPSVYVRPEISPYSLVWLPVESENNVSNIHRTLCAVMDDTGPNENEGILIKGRSRSRQIAYRDILYIEAADKKLVLRLKYEEIPFRGSLEKLSQNLPEEFVRIHKGYIVNLSHVVCIDWKNHAVGLGEDDWLPCSRSYQNALRERFDESKQ